MSTYQLFGDKILRDGSAWIPADPANRDYAEYLEWVAAGNTPDSTQYFAQLKAAKLQAISQARDAQIAGGVPFKGATFWSDRDSVVDVMIALASLDAVAKLPPDMAKQFGAVPAVVTRKAHSNGSVVYVSLTPDELRVLLLLLSTWSEQAYGQEGALVAAVAAAQRPEDLATIAWAAP